jgi:EAL domain-containing protein (putative c-di-GMP-specific phosphodiesterase class I)
LHYQPLINVGEGRIKGFEALLRMRDDKGNFVPPVDFIPVAEETNLIDEIGSWVLTEACKTAANWPNNVEISVNLSAAQFRRKSVVDATSKALTESGLEPKRLLLEITESLLLSDTDHVLVQLKQLKTLGVSIIMDDFGTGYSSLSYMMRFPFDGFKIDRSFVASLDNPGGEARKVVQTIISLGHSLNMKVTAEGVETQKQADILSELRCDDAQGWLYGRPMPVGDVSIALLRSVIKKPEAPEAGEKPKRRRA